MKKLISAVVGIALLATVSSVQAEISAFTGLNPNMPWIEFVHKMDHDANALTAHVALLNLNALEQRQRWSHLRF